MKRKKIVKILGASLIAASLAAQASTPQLTKICKDNTKAQNLNSIVENKTKNMSTMSAGVKTERWATK